MNKELKRSWYREIHLQKEYYKTSYLETVNNMLNYIRVNDTFSYTNCLMIVTEKSGTFTSSVNIAALIVIRRKLLINEILSDIKNNGVM